MEAVSFKKLIVNADDLGLHSSVNRAVIKAHREGIVSSATILVGGSAFHEAVDMCSDYPELGIGIHLCLVDQVPVASVEHIPSLLESNGRLIGSYGGFLKRLLRGKIKLTEIRTELDAQIRTALEAGLKITHFDSHQHLHLLPQVAPIIVDLAGQNDVQYIRLPAETRSIGPAASTLRRRLEGRFVSLLASRFRDRFCSDQLKSSDYFYGFSTGGNFEPEIWRSIVPNIPVGVTEIMVHPGDDDVTLSSFTNWDYHWETELEALSDPKLKTQVDEQQIRLIHYGNID